MSLKLCTKNLASIASQVTKNAAPAVTVPNYDRNGMKEGIVHIGVGGFARAHLAVYVHKLLSNPNAYAAGARNYAICGVGLTPFDTKMRDVLAEQDGLYTVIERSAAGSVAHVVGSIRSFLFAPDDREAVVAKMAHEDTRIVSMTITESGYYYNENTHELQANHPDIQHDADPANAKSPKTTFGFLYAALIRRRAAGMQPFTVLSCDNMQHNGFIARKMLESFARLADPSGDTAKWIGEKGAFPNAMVDRITPQTSDNDRKSLDENFGVADKWPVVTEPFMQWVVEDKFCNGRPDFAQVGAQIVPGVKEVEQFEKHKLRLLNGSHSAIGYPGHLAGYKYVHEVMENPMYKEFIWNMMQQEVKPSLPAIPGVDIDKYCATLIERFSNPTIMDQLPRICLGASGKIPQFIMPSIAEAIWVSGPFRRLCFVAAAWFVYLRGVDDKGNPFAIDDPMKEELQARAKRGGDAPHELLAVKSLFGDDLRGDERFIKEISTAMELISKDGIMATLPKYV